MIDRNASNAEKIRFFRSLFAGREDVFARRYEARGTSPLRVVWTIRF